MKNAPPAPKALPEGPRIQPKETGPQVADLATVLITRSGGSLESCLEAAGMGLCLLSPEGRVLSVNRTMVRLLGYTAAQLRDMPLRRILHPEEANLDSLLFQRLRKGEVESYRITSRCLRKDGREVRLGSVVARVADGAGVVGFVRLLWDTHAGPGAAAGLPAGLAEGLPAGLPQDDQPHPSAHETMEERLAHEIVRRVKAERVETAARLAARVLLGTADLGALTSEMERAVRVVMPADEVAILSRSGAEPGAPLCSLGAAQHPSPAMLALARQAVDAGQPVALDEEQIATLAAQEPDSRDWRLPRAWMGVPVAGMGDAPMGLVAVANHSPGASYGTQELAMLTLMSQYLGRAVERSLAEAALRRSEARFRCVFEHAAIGVATLDLDGKVLDMNRAGQALLGYTPQELRAMRFLDLSHPDDVEASRQAFDQLRAGTRESYEVTARCVRNDGETVWGRQVVSLVRDEAGRPWFAISMLEDITEQRQAEDLLVRQAFHDELTGLPNRSLFMDRLEASLRHARRDPAQACTVLFLDLNRFKVVNDSLGHAAGDQLLQEIGWRLSSCLRQVDTLARFGGDEFAVLLEATTDPAEVLGVIERIQELFQTPFQIHDHEIFAGASIGVVTVCGDARAEDVIRDADIAMYRAKESGRLGYAFFDREMHEQVKGILRTETDLRKALDRGEFELYYQPIVDLSCGRLTGLEALIRWNHPERGLVMPGDFIPLAEESGFIFEIDRWTLAWACSALSLWRERFPRAAQITVSVNLSANFFIKKDAVDDLKAILDLTAVDPRGLRLEITENLILSADEHTRAKLFSLREMGLSLVLDDFGTGYSSLSYLRRFPFDCLKIDRSFVIRMLEDQNDLAIVQAILSLGKTLGIEVVAEGVETGSHVTRLADLGCPLGQGYHFARPMPAAQVERLLAGGQLLPLGG